MNYFVVFQNKTFNMEKDAGVLWAPKHDKHGGKPKFHWANMQKCEAGDVVFSVVRNEVVSRSIVKKEAKSASNPYNNNLWTDQGWLVELDYNFTIKKIAIKDHIEEIKPLLPSKYSPFNENTGRGNQGYLYQVPQKLGQLLDDLIMDVVKDYNLNHDEILQDIDDNKSLKVEEKDIIDRSKVILREETPPSESNIQKQKRKKVYSSKIDYVSKAKQDQEKGLYAEELVYHYEKQHLKKQGQTDLANNVKWVAKEADGYGYDILSFDLDGTEKYIEVKSTSLGKNTPFDITKNEVETSNKYKNQYWIYRLYHIDQALPHFYKFQGEIEKHFFIEPTSYKAYLKKK